ncbi:hypothetical protein [Caballeronia mineralivorans]|jgi:hypothetical protein|uniref:hypothetical protein n=1 Tax=Caballeronia mineralivorans TaxID=2010198 RepID=UPI0023F4F92A|nr:hypothetical protein [Caballeronia mineralivorans]
MGEMNDQIEEDWDGPHYRRPEEIDPAGLRSGLSRLELFSDDAYLQMQAFNLSVVDEFATKLEYEVLAKLIEQEATPLPEATFLLAQSQMWIFAAYELVRTWQQRAKNVVKWFENGGLELKIEALEKDVGYHHFGRIQRADELRRVSAEPAIVDKIKSDLKLVHIPFARLEAIRISIAKHEVQGRRNSVALRPGYGRINQWCGSLDFELENGAYSMGYISRRDVADELRALASRNEPPADDVLAEFDAYMRGPVDG